MTKQEIQQKAQIHSIERFGRISPAYELGFEDGADLMRFNHPSHKDIPNDNTIPVDSEWLKSHDKQLIDKSCEWIENYLFNLGCPDDWCRNGDLDYRKTMEDQQ